MHALLQSQPPQDRLRTVMTGTNRGTLLVQGLPTSCSSCPAMSASHGVACSRSVCS